jgi:hypothetical protein
MIEDMRDIEPIKEHGNDFIADVSARLYSLKLNETLHADMKWGVRTDITRVPGGWIYQPICRHSNGKDEYYAPCFVPFNNEFQNVR